MVNLIKNSGFEAEPLGVDWVLNNAIIVNDNLADPLGPHVAKINSGGSISQTITLLPNTTYFLQFDARPWRTDIITVNVGGKILSFPVISSVGYVGVTPQTFMTGSSPTNSISFSFPDTVFLDRIDLELVGAPAVTYDCINNACVINNAGTGTYATLAACQAACGVVPPSGYNCENNECVASTSGAGQYATLEACQEACETVVPPTANSSLVYVAAAGLIAVILYKVLKKKEGK